jgi:hypothetical protein
VCRQWCVVNTGRHCGQGDEQGSDEHGRYRKKVRSNNTCNWVLLLAILAAELSDYDTITALPSRSGHGSLNVGQELLVHV